MAFSLTVNGVETEVLIESLNVNSSLYGERGGGMRGHFLSEDGSLDIPLESDIVFALNGTRLFAGTVAKAHLRGADGPGGDGNDSIVWEVEARDLSWPLDYRVVTVTIPDGSTVKEAIQLLMPELPELTLSGSQSDGPALPEMVFERTKIRDAFNRIVSEAIAADAFGWFLRITHHGVLLAFEPGAAVAPWNLTEGEGSECGDVETDDRRDDDYATRVIVEGGTVTEIEREEAFIVAPGQTQFTLEYTPFKSYGYVTNSGTGNMETLGPVGDPDNPFWELDPVTRILTKANGGAPTTGATITIKFDGTLQIIGDTGPTSPGPDRIVVETVEGITTTAEADAAAARILAELSASQKTAMYPTRRHGLQAGDQQIVTTAKRKIPTPTTFYVTELVLTYDGAVEGDGLLYKVTVAESIIVKGNFRSTFRRWADVGSGGGANTVQPGVASVCGWTMHDKPTVMAKMIGVDSEVIARGKNGGENFGVEVLPAALSSMTTDDDTVALALGNKAAGADKALTFWTLADGSHYIEAEQSISILTSDSGIDIDASGVGSTLSLSGTLRSYIDKASISSEFHEVVYITTQPSYTLDAADHWSVYLFDPSGGDVAVALPPIAGIYITDGTTNPSDGRTLYLKNISATQTVTLNPDGAETIDGDADLELAPGESCVIQATRIAGAAGWHVLATNGAGGGGADPLTVIGPGSATDLAIARWDGTTGTLLQDSALVLADNGTLTFPDGIRQTFNPNATNAGLNVGSHAADPSAMSNGDIVYQSTDHEYRVRVNGTNRTLLHDGSDLGVAAHGHLTEDGSSAPPVDLYNEAGDDWLYADGV